MEKSRFGLVDALLAVLVFGVAVALRLGYVAVCCEDQMEPPPVQVQDAETAINLVHGSDFLPTARDVLVDNLRRYNWFANHAPLSKAEEPTARVAPGYPWLVAWLANAMDDPQQATRTLRRVQCGLGALTAVFYFLFARLAFGSSFVGFMAGLLTAIHPFWIVNVAELQDGTLAAFLLGGCLFLGTAATQRGNVLGSFLFGGCLAGVALVRAAFLPYAFVACLWFLLRCRGMPRGWVCALLAVLGFGNGLAPWMVYNMREYGDVVPITDSLYLDLWIGSNSKAWGGPQNEQTLRETLLPDRLEALLDKKNQAHRYGMLAVDLKERLQENPTGVIEKRLRSGICFLFGAAWFKDYTLAREHWTPTAPHELAEGLPLALRLSLVLMFGLGLLGWRWSYGWDREANLGSLALLWVPLPYILSHADFYSGSRLPLDGVFLTFAAFALGWMFPPVARIVFPEPERAAQEEW